MSERPLRQDARVDEPGIVGARWWQDSVVDPVGRRQAILTLLVASVASTANLGADYTPVARRTQFSSGVAGGGRPMPSEFGSVPVVLGLAGGALLGVAWSRSGTWNRGGGGFWHHGWGG